MTVLDRKGRPIPKGEKDGDRGASNMTSSLDEDMERVRERPIEGKPPPRPAGRYRVKAGTVHLGPGQSASVGDVVDLDAKDAATLVQRGVVEPA